jgi:hypothetical protein
VTEAQPERALDRPDEAARPGEADPRVGAAVRRLDELDGLAPAEHVEIYESVHHRLQEALAEAADDDDPRVSAADDRRAASP